MYLLEHDAKQLLSTYDIPVPLGGMFTSAREPLSPQLPPGPWVVKGQIARGGRGKLGIVKKARTEREVIAHLTDMLGRRVQGHTVHSARVEQDIGIAQEAYIALMLEHTGEVRILLAAEGGMDIEGMAQEDGIRCAISELESTAIKQAIRDLLGPLPVRVAAALQQAGDRLSEVFLQAEALLVEVNPLFVRPDGSWVAGDAKVVTDDNALERQPYLRRLVENRASVYPEVALKLEHGFDYVVVDDDGEIGLITSGAGLCMMLIDELRSAGLRPFNFLDVRASAFHGETTRLVHVLNWISRGRNVKMIMVNMIAGGGDVGEHADLLMKALDEVRFELPIVVRFAGRNLAEGERILAERGVPLHTDLDSAIAEVGKVLTRLAGAKQ